MWNNPIYDSEVAIYIHKDDLDDFVNVQRNVSLILKLSDRMRLDFGVLPDMLEFCGEIGCKLYDKIMESKRYDFGHILISRIPTYDNKIVWKYSKKVWIQRENGGAEHERPIHGMMVPGWVTTPPVDYSMSFAYTTEKEEQPQIVIAIINPDDLINKF